MDPKERADAFERRDRPAAKRIRAGGAVEPDTPRAFLVPESGPNGAPSKVGRYVVLDVLGVGGMGVVCTAYDPKLDRKVALKLLRQSKSKRGTTGQARLVREAQALAKLSHPNIITVHDVDTTLDGRIFMAMEFVQGKTITQWLAEEPRPWREILAVFDYAGKGLAAAHAGNITHRDFKPANVLIGSDGRVRVLDFGLAKNADSNDSTDSEDSHMEFEGDDIMEMVNSASDMKLTRAGRIVGTPAYMAPEQRRAKGVGPATDQFSFCVALYEALYGRLPFRADSHSRDAARGKVLDPPKDSVVPAWVMRALRVGLAPTPRQRYPTMSALLFALRSDPAVRRRKLMLGTGATLLSASALVGLYTVREDGDLCHGARGRLAGVWDSDARDNVDAALRSSSVAYAAHTADRVVDRLDAYADDWVEARVSVCEATWVHGEQSEGTLDVRMGCLDQRHGELRALGAVLADANDDVVERAIAAVGGLQDPADCITVDPQSETRLPADPGKREAVLSVLARLDDAEALGRAGRYTQALDAATEALHLAQSIEHPPTIARALLSTGTASMRLRQDDLADTRLTEAANKAAELGDSTLEARAAIARVRVQGVFKRNRERALGIASAADSAITRAGGGPDLRAQLAQELGASSLKARELDDALAQQRVALKFAEEAYTPNDLRFASLYSNLGVTLAELGETSESEVYLRRALELRESKLGAMHPLVAGIAQNLANVLASNAEDLPEALSLIDRAMKIRRATFGPQSDRVAALWVAKARLHSASGDRDKAMVELEQAAELYRATKGTNGLGATLNNLAVLQLEMGRFADALGTADEARAIYQGDSPAQQLGRARSEIVRCQSQRKLGTLSAAEVSCRAAAEGMRELHGETHEEVAASLLELARLYAQMRDTDRAIDHARRAVAAAAQDVTRSDATKVLTVLQDVGPSGLDEENKD